MEKIKKILEKAYNEGRKSLSEIEVYEILKILDLNVPLYIFAEKKNINDDFIKNITNKIKTKKVVIKIVSSTNLHKTDTGGVKVVSNEFSEIKKVIDKFLNFNDIDGIAAFEFIEHIPFHLGHELLLGAKNDDAFGPVITLGPGGTHTESFIKALKKEYSTSFIPVFNITSGDENVDDFVENVWISNYLFGKVRGLDKLVEKKELSIWVSKISEIMNYFSDKNGEFTIEEFEINPLALSNGKFYALDGVLRFRKSVKKDRNIPSYESINAIVNPQTIGVVGVSEKKMNMARIILNNTIKAGFDKSKMVVIKEGVDEIDGVKAYSKISEVPFVIDMLVVAVPVNSVMDVIEESVNSGKVRGLVLITGGIGEKSGSEKLAEKLIEIINNARNSNNNFALNGGNCMGIVLNHKKVNTFFIPEYKMKYPIGFNEYMSKTAFVSQSGAFVISVLTKIPHIIPDYTITVGNQQDITVVDYIDYFVNKTDTKVILSYIEGFKPYDGIRLINITKKAIKEGRIIVLYKAGRTSLGQKAVMGHTASIAGDYIVFEKLLEKSGALVCDNFDEFIDITYLSTYISRYDIKSFNSFFISNAGFETTAMADNVTILKANEPSEGLKKNVGDVLKKYGLDSLVDFKNPMDVTPMACDDAISEIVENVMRSKDYDISVVSMIPLTPNMNTLPTSPNYPDKLEKSFINRVSILVKETKKPVFLSVASGNLYDPYVDYAIEKGFVVFRNVDRLIKAIEKYFKYFGRR